MQDIFNVRFPEYRRLPRGIVLFDQRTGQFFRPGGRWASVVRPTQDGMQVILLLKEQHFLAPAALLGYYPVYPLTQEKLKFSNSPAWHNQLVKLSLTPEGGSE